MCQCTPSIKTPFCGQGDCQWPPQPPKPPNRKFAMIVESDDTSVMLKRDDEGRELFTINGHVMKVRAPRIEIVGDSVSVSFFMPLAAKDRSKE